MTYCLFRSIACIDTKSIVNCLPAFPVFAVCQASKSTLVLDVSLSIIFLLIFFNYYFLMFFPPYIITPASLIDITLEDNHDIVSDRQRSFTAISAHASTNRKHFLAFVYV